MDRLPTGSFGEGRWQMLGWLRRLWGGLSGAGAGGTPVGRLRPLLREAGSPDAAVRERAALGLGGHADARAAGALLPLLADPHGPVREAARGSLRRIGR